MASMVTLLRSRSVITIINRGSPLFFAGKSVIKSIESSLWNLLGIGRGQSNPLRCSLQSWDLPQTSQFQQNLHTIVDIPGQWKFLFRMAKVLSLLGCPVI